MNFKRQEGFRFVFNEPIDAKFKIIINGQANVGTYDCKILDISPRGIKMFSTAQIGEYLNSTTLQIEVQFVLDVTMIYATGDIVWSKPYAGGIQYGVLFHAREDIGELIISEMKLRRKKEVMQAKLKR